MGMCSPGLTVQEAVAYWVPWCLDVEPQGLSRYLCLVATLVTWLALTVGMRIQREGRGQGPVVLSLGNPFPTHPEAGEASSRGSKTEDGEGAGGWQKLWARAGQTLVGAGFAHLNGCH